MIKEQNCGHPDCENKQHERDADVKRLFEATECEYIGCKHKPGSLILINEKAFFLCLFHTFKILEQRAIDLLQFAAIPKPQGEHEKGS